MRAESSWPPEKTLHALCRIRESSQRVDSLWALIPLDVKQKDEIKFKLSSNMALQGKLTRRIWLQSLDALREGNLLLNGFVIYNEFNIF